MIDFKITHNLQDTVSVALMKLNIRPHINGFHYIASAVEICVQNPAELKGITKELYPRVAEIHGTTPSRVERGIRHAIEKSVSYEQSPDFEAIFGECEFYKNFKPTNSEFLATLVEKIRIANYT